MDTITRTAVVIGYAATLAASATAILGAWCLTQIAEFAHPSADPKAMGWGDDDGA